MNTTNSYFIENGVLKYLPIPGLTDVKLQVYEVLRVIDGVPLFAEDHVERLLNSCSLSGVEIPQDSSPFLDQLNILTVANRLVVGNLKIDLVVQSSGEPVWQMYPVEHRYPTAINYSDGVRCGVLRLERANPQAKVVQQGVREQANAAIAANNWYEVILINTGDCVTEGSRSNVFFIKDEMVFTAPADQVLSGITRAKVIDCIESLGIQVVQQPIHSDQLATFDAAFISGTSPKILPIAQIYGDGYSVGHPVLRQLMEAYDALIASYIAARQSSSAKL